jgi:ubiquinone/menaquinone biosynthesis C-methylase UbiE
MSLQGGEKILDVGAGLGQFSRAMARAAGPEARVVGVERDAAQIAEARRQAELAGEGGLVEWRSGDAAALPLESGEWGGFDVAHTRFLLEHVPDPPAIVRQMLRAVRPGGRIVLADDDHELLRFWPKCRRQRTRGTPTSPPTVRRETIRSSAGGSSRSFTRRALFPGANTYIFFGARRGTPTSSPS